MLKVLLSVSPLLPPNATKPLPAAQPGACLGFARACACPPWAAHIVSLRKRCVRQCFPLKFANFSRIFAKFSRIFAKFAEFSRIFAGFREFQPKLQPKPGLGRKRRSGFGSSKGLISLGPGPKPKFMPRPKPETKSGLTNN